MSLGKNGDFYVNRDNGNYYAKVDDVWVLRGNLRDLITEENGGTDDPGVNDSTE
jgi:hypothetical protein